MSDEWAEWDEMMRRQRPELYAPTEYDEGPESEEQELRVLMIF